MDKKIILAVAGSGKTRLLINSLNLKERALLITYTTNNFSNIRQRIIEKFGYFPDNITIYSYFTFLYSFCYKPFLALKVKARGINWDTKLPLYKKSNEPAYYIDTSRRLYHARIAKLLAKQKIMNDVIARLEKYFDAIFVDEVQDFAGNDFNFLSSIAKANLKLLFVGDYFQHTFDTSRDGNVNGTLYDDHVKYKKRFEEMGLLVDTETLDKSYRCSPSVCSFISDSIGIEISSHRSDDTTVSLIENKVLVDEKFKCNDTVKLFYQDSHKYPCYGQNWGDSKGQNHYEDVCIVLNKKSYELLKACKLNELPPRTKNKLYVACTRARNNLYLVSNEHIKKHKLAEKSA